MLNNKYIISFVWVGMSLEYVSKLNTSKPIDHNLTFNCETDIKLADKFNLRQSRKIIFLIKKRFRNISELSILYIK